MHHWLLGWALLVSQPDDGCTIALDQQPLLRIQRQPFQFPAQSMTDPAQVQALIKRLEQAAYRAPVNATISPAGHIVDGRNGAQLDTTALSGLLYAYWYGQGTGHIELPTRPIYPRVDAELLAQIRVKPIGSYVTYFNSRNTNRTKNISLAAQAINNYVLFPNETFSFNRIVGERTRAKGYMTAKIIVRGEFSEGIGGGICQVSSTLFNAVDRAGLQTTQRYSHSRSVPYVPPGRDATVSWGGPDYVFRNPYNVPVLIRAFASPGSVSVQLFSSDTLKHAPRQVPPMSSAVPEEIDAAQSPTHLPPTE